MQFFLSRLLRLAVPIPLTILGLGRAIVFRLALRLPEAQELDSSGTTSLCENLLDAKPAAYGIMYSSHSTRGVVGANMTGVSAGPKNVGDGVEGESSDGLRQNIPLINKRRDLVVSGRHLSKHVRKCSSGETTAENRHSER